jgi:hypothetical protein
MRVSQDLREIKSKGKHMPTNKELELQLTEMNERNEALSQRLLAIEEVQVQTQQRAEIADLPTSFRDAPDGGGWVIRTPNKSFNGDTCATRFVQGMAVITKDAPDAERKVKAMMNEFGYSSQPVTEDDLNSFNRYITNNLAALMDGKSADMEGKLANLQPVFGGVVRGG